MLLRNLLRHLLGTKYGELPWDQAQNQYPRKTEGIIQSPVKLKELAVFSQAENQWAIRMIIADKMKSSLRNNKHDNPAKKDKTTSVDDVAHDEEEIKHQLPPCHDTAVPRSDNKRARLQKVGVRGGAVRHRTRAATVRTVRASFR